MIIRFTCTFPCTESELLVSSP